MKSLIIAFSLLVFTEIQLILCANQDSDTPMTADEIKTVAVAERNAAIENAKLAHRSAVTEINVIRQEAEKERDAKLKLVKEKIQKANAIASTIRRSATRELAKSLQDAKNEYVQVVHQGSKQKLEKLNEEYNSLVEAAENQFVKKYIEMTDTKKKIESENRELLEKVRKEIEAEEKLADEKKKQALEEYKLGLRNKNGASVEDWNSLEPICKYEEELGRYEKTVESLEEKWQKTLDDLGIGQEYEAALENALMELKETKKKAESDVMDAKKKIAQAAIEAKKALDEKQASANADKLKAETEATEILESYLSQRNKILEKTDRKYRGMRMLIEAEMKNAAIELSEAIDAAKSEYEKALKKATEMERLKKRTKSGERDLY